MMNNIINQLVKISQSPWYWRLYVVAGTSLLAVALTFQHVLEEPPCLLCIQVRLLVSSVVIIALIALFTMRYKPINILAHLATVLVAAMLTERSYQLLGTERGFVIGECGFDLGLPAWFTPDVWIPAMFQVETSCGYTPELMFGISMAEALIVLSAGFLLVTAGMTVAALAHLRS